jgi:hypothetical protein
MMWIVNSIFAQNIMTTRIGDCLSTFMMWIVKRDVSVFSAIHMHN